MVVEIVSGGVTLDDGTKGAVFKVVVSGGLLACFSPSKVIPSFNFVNPTMGGSPFITNSHWPDVYKS